MVLFAAGTRGRKWSVRAVELEDGSVRITWYKHGKSQCTQNGLDRESARDSVAKTIVLEKHIDKINYIIQTDNLGVGELAS